MGPHPYPYMVRELQRVVGDEARAQCRAAARRGRPRRGGRLRRRRLQRGGDLRRLRRHRGPPGRAWRRPAGRRSADGRPRRAARHAVPAPPGRGGPDPRGPLDLGRPRLPGHRARARPPGRDRAGRRYAAGRPTTRCSTPSGCSSETEGIIPALEPAHALAWVVARGRPRDPGRVDRADHAVGPGRQGRGPGARPARPSRRRRACHRPTGAAAGPGVGPARPAATAGAKLLVPYVMAGMAPDWVEVLQAVAAAGADAVEVGIPFSDPMMDGPVIQAGLAWPRSARGTTPARRCSTSWPAPRSGCPWR